MKRNHTYLLLLAIAIIASDGLRAQSMRLYHKYEGGKLLIRWNPANAGNWLESIYQGYVIEKYEDGVLAMESDIPVMANSFGYLSLHQDSLGTMRHLVASLNHIEEVEDSLVAETFPAEDYSEVEREEARLALLNYILNFDFGLTLFAGLGYVDDEIEAGKNYSYVIKRFSFPGTIPGNSDTLFFNTDTYQEPGLPPFTAQWSNRKVSLSWPTISSKVFFYGYSLEKSVEGGPFQPLDSVPIMNLYDTSTNEIFHQIEVKDILDDNNKVYTYRLRGLDYFGDTTFNYLDVSGTGKMEIGLSPMFTESNQLESNEVVLKWKLLDQFRNLVKEFRLYRAESWDGPYIQDTIGISPELREITRPIPYPSTYFRIAAVDDSKNEHSSFPQLVVALDTMAPAIPEDLKAHIDTQGILELTWSSNDEEDFLGYKVFFSNDTLHPFGLAHYDFLPEPVFRDTISLQSINEQIYFKIISVDERNNRSPFSKVLTVKKPDIIAPVQPAFYNSIPGPGLCLLQWHPSISEDVVQLNLYRRILDVEDSWKEIASWVGDNLPVEYLDTLLKPELYYAYVLQVTDDAGNLSNLSEPIVVNVYPDYELDVNQFRLVKVDNPSGIRIEFDFSMESIYQVWIYKQLPNGRPRILKKIVAPQRSYVDHQVASDRMYTYFVKAVFIDGVQSDFSTPKKMER